MLARATSARIAERPRCTTAAAASGRSVVSGFGGDSGGSAGFGWNHAGPRGSGIRKTVPRALRRRSMKACWPEGSLRAYHDGELLPADMEKIAAHLAECPQCEALADEVAGRANRVAALMSALPPAEQVIWMPRRVSAPVRRRLSAWPVWAGAAAALAAGMAIATWMAPRPEEHRAAAPPEISTPVAPAQTAGGPAIPPGVKPIVEPRALPAAHSAGVRSVRRAARKQVGTALEAGRLATGTIEPARS